MVYRTKRFRKSYKGRSYKGRVNRVSGNLIASQQQKDSAEFVVKFSQVLTVSNLAAEDRGSLAIDMDNTIRASPQWIHIQNLFDEYRIESVGVKFGIRAFAYALTLVNASKFWSAWDRNGSLPSGYPVQTTYGPWTYGSAKSTLYSASNSQLHHYTSLRPSGILETSGWFATDNDNVQANEQRVQSGFNPALIVGIQYNRPYDEVLSSVWDVQWSFVIKARGTRGYL